MHVLTCVMSYVSQIKSAHLCTSSDARYTSLEQTSFPGNCTELLKNINYVFQKSRTEMSKYFYTLRYKKTAGNQ